MIDYKRVRIRTLINVIILIFSLVFLEISFAKNIGTIGQTYVIQETDFLEFIQSRVLSMQQNGQWLALQQSLQTRAQSYRDRPKAISDIQRATQAKSWKWDPSIVLDHDIKTPDGKIIARQGTRVNPLDYMHLSKTLIFYDADDQDQVKWAVALDKKLKGRDKLILVKGSLLAEEKRFSKSVYFDQEGRLVKRFGMSQVPATVTQEGNSLKIVEVQL